VERQIEVPRFGGPHEYFAGMVLVLEVLHASMPVRAHENSRNAAG
jgi:hypothetical protein